MIRCQVCGAKIEEGLEICPYCGSKIETGDSKTVWTELAEKEEQEEKKAPPKPADENPHKQIYYVEPAITSASQAGAQPQAAKNKKWIGIVSAILIIVFVGAVGIYLAGGGIGNKVTEDDAREGATTYYMALLDDAILMEDAGLDIANFWYEALENGNYGGTKEGALEEALSLHQDNIDSVMGNQANITSLYNEAMDMAEKTGMDDLADAMEDMYDDYFEFIDAVMNTDTSFEEYIETLTEADDDLAASINLMYDLLA